MATGREGGPGGGDRPQEPASLFREDWQEHAIHHSPRRNSGRQFRSPGDGRRESGNPADWGADGEDSCKALTRGRVDRVTDIGPHVTPPTGRGFGGVRPSSPATARSPAPRTAA